MKKPLLFILTFLTFTIANGQFNPIKNLYFNCWYETPMNCWVLSWSQPDQSPSDTLVGYNIFRNDSLYLFITNTSITYNPCSGSPDTTYVRFTNYNSGYFWIHVTAVYNTAHLQSIYNDSINNGGCGLMIGVKEYNYNNKFQIAPNPFSKQTTLQTDVRLNNVTLSVVNCFGQQVKQIKNISRQTIVLYRDNLPSGIYFLQLTQNNEILTTGKILITDN